ncbi:MAG: SH3 domain-containing protein [Deltaproteobacteria bacterium]|nr:SH3 domain-containing protein [Deltaproteobacteria bacterium]
MTRIAHLFVIATFALGAIGCTTAAGDGEDELVGVQEPEDDDTREAESVTGSLSAGQQLRTNANLNLRASPSTGARILHVIPDGALVTVVSGTPKSGWYNIKHNGQSGWSYGVYVDKISGVVGAESCSPSRAVGVVSAKRKALLDTIAYAEGTKGHGYDGYNILYAYRTISDCNRHPNRVICSGAYCSSAAGRYQFLNTTWNGLGLPNFRPENQTRGAMTLIAWRKGTVPADRAMTATEFANLMNKISYEWASLPPGRYGQPIKSMSSLRGVYCGYAGC